MFENVPPHIRGVWRALDGRFAGWSFVVVECSLARDRRDFEVPCRVDLVPHDCERWHATNHSSCLQWASSWRNCTPIVNRVSPIHPEHGRTKWRRREHPSPLGIAYPRTSICLWWLLKQIVRRTFKLVGLSFKTRFIVIIIEPHETCSGFFWWITPSLDSVSTGCLTTVRMQRRRSCINWLGPTTILSMILSKLYFLISGESSVNISIWEICKFWMTFCTA